MGNYKQFDVDSWRDGGGWLTPAPVLYLTGDVHWGRAGEAWTCSAPTLLYEVIGRRRA